MSFQKRFIIVFVSVIAFGGALGCGHSDDDTTTRSTTTSRAVQGANQQGGRGGTTGGAAGSGGARAAARGGNGASQDPSTTGRADAGAAAAGSDGDALDDEHAAQVMLTINSGAIMQGELAVMRAADERVRAYATRMVTEHTAANAMLMALTGRLGITPMDTDLSRQLLADATSALASLRGAPEAEFDLAYVTAQVMQHERALMLFDSLEPQLADDDLRAATEMLRRTVAEHLDDGRTLRAALGDD
jgi:putative membrane protein